MAQRKRTPGMSLLKRGNSGNVGDIRKKEVARGGDLDRDGVNKGGVTNIPQSLILSLSTGCEKEKGLGGKKEKDSVG